MNGYKKKNIPREKEKVKSIRLGGPGAPGRRGLWRVWWNPAPDWAALGCCVREIDAALLVLEHNSGPTMLDEESLMILQYLGEMKDIFVKQGKIAATIGVHESTVLSRLQNVLRPVGFTEKNARTGETITPKGQEYLLAHPG